MKTSLHSLSAVQRAAQPDGRTCSAAAPPPLGLLQRSAAVLFGMRFLLWLRLVTTFCGLSAACCSGLAAGPATGDEFWLISSRNLTSNICRADLVQPNLRASMADACGRLHPRALEDLFTRYEGGATAIYIHGNRFDPYQAIERARFVYRNVVQCRAPGQSVRWIVFSWPSERSGVLLADPREKARRTETHGLYLGWMLQQMAGEQNLTLIGYSFGARVATGALHAAAGGALSGRQLPGAPVQGLTNGLVLVAPALDRCWLAPGGYHQLAVSNVQRLNVFYNSIDPVLKRYWLVDEGEGGDAMGCRGLGGLAARPDSIPIQVRQLDCRRSVGPQHDEIGFFDPPCNAGGRIAQVLWPQRIETGEPIEVVLQNGTEPALIVAE